METIFQLLILSIPVACVAWTVTHEEVFREVHEYCVKRSKKAKSIFVRKFFYLFTCEYCFSHYVTIALLFITRYTLFIPDWRGYILAFFSIVFIANVYMSLFAKIRIDIKKERTEVEQMEQDL
ncbi:MAG TPA: hypothetical protein VGO63_02200 [Candidatus Paceibacterota bacterium]|nr:hypothetical protein [Candidatus Paceibacterota bacterium]